MSGAWWDEPGVMRSDPNEVINLESDDENDNNMGTNNANNADNPDSTVYTDNSDIQKMQIIPCI